MKHIFTLIFSALLFASCQKEVICHDVEDFLNVNPSIEKSLEKHSKMFSSCKGEIDMLSIGYEKVDCNTFLVSMRYEQCCNDVTVQRWAFALYDYSGTILNFQNE